MAEDTAEVSKHSCVTGYHVYKDVSRAAIGKESVCQREQGNYGVFSVSKITRGNKTYEVGVKTYEVGCKTY